ncbi:sensor histidine kinase [Hymenobacter negativus]|uniref:Sensor histidine kinase n=1 Tax=Hymenobacter negativus TaxID=2795026 RepID=A0ABS3QK26_9BACT|nr:histidine kinase [Hymenobacter negativus]MBO2011615.1 sensor histidine kinase [Hymenobacter negativus]
MTAFLSRPWTLALHASFWLVYGYLSVYQFQQEHPMTLLLWLGLVGSLLLDAALAYLNYFYLLPRFLRTRRRLEYFFFLAVPYAATVALRVLTDRTLFAPVISRKYLYSPGHTWTVAIGVLFIDGFVTMLYFAANWFVLEARAKALENENLTAELRYLKAQLNPHFLFNTLNNLYYLAHSRSERTPEVVATLAQMMRYMLEEANRPVVALSREIEYLTSYIQLEKLRLNSPIPITLTVAGQPNGLVVAPLIFMAFLENAFKHGVSTTSTTAWVHVHFDLTSSDCCYTVANSKLPVPAARVGPASTGLPNVRRRLALSYPDRHELRIEDLPTEYRIHLRLTL